MQFPAVSYHKRLADHLRHREYLKVSLWHSYPLVYSLPHCDTVVDEQSQCQRLLFNLIYGFSHDITLQLAAHATVAVQLLGVGACRGRVTQCRTGWLQRLLWHWTQG
jgi:hypothetical protein